MNETPAELRDKSRSARLALVKSVHTIVWAFFVACIGAIWVFALRGEIVGAGIAIAIVLIEVAVATAFAADGRLPGACFNASRDFGRALPADVPALQEQIRSPAPQVQQATAMRNQGIEACLAGKVKEGAEMIKHATAMLKG